VRAQEQPLMSDPEQSFRAIALDKNFIPE
jgi:hypothetical protein